MEQPIDPMDRLHALLTNRSTATRNGSERRWTPLGDMRQTDRDYTLFLDLPGIDEDELEITVSNGNLIVSGEREFDHDKEDAEDYTRLDRPYGRFHYEIALQGSVDVDQMSAKYRRGVLKVSVPRNKS